MDDVELREGQCFGDHLIVFADGVALVCGELALIECVDEAIAGVRKLLEFGEAVSGGVEVSFGEDGVMLVGQVLYRLCSG